MNSHQASQKSQKHPAKNNFHGESETSSKNKNNLRRRVRNIQQKQNNLRRRVRNIQRKPTFPEESETSRKLPQPPQKSPKHPAKLQPPQKSPKHPRETASNLHRRVRNIPRNYKTSAEESETLSEITTTFTEEAERSAETDLLPTEEFSAQEDSELPQYNRNRIFFL